MSRFTEKRRQFLKATAFTAAAFATPGLMAEELTRTPSSTEGPFYPDKLPLDTDNDLLIINDAMTPAIGKITHLSGTVVDVTGKPIKNAGVEIWQVDGKGSYLHSRGDGGKGRDKSFQGFGRFTTNRKGEYYFRTIRPVPYPGRTPHIHFAVNLKGKRAFTGQLYFHEFKKRNAADFLYKRLGKNGQKLCTIGTKPIKGSKLGEVAGDFRIVLGKTPAG